MTKPYRVRTALVTGGAGPITLVCTETASNRYQLRKEYGTAGSTLQTALLAEGPLDVVEKFFDRAKHGLLLSGGTLAAEWTGRGSAEHELRLALGQAQAECRRTCTGETGYIVPEDSVRVVACLRAGELAYRVHQPLAPETERSLKAFLGHDALAGKVLDLLVSEVRCTLLQVLTPGVSREALYAQVPALRPRQASAPSSTPPLLRGEANEVLDVERHRTGRFFFVAA